MVRKITRVVCNFNYTIFEIITVKVNRQRPTYSGKIAHISINMCDNQNLQKAPCAQDHDSQVITLLPTVALRTPLASLSIQVSVFFGTYDNPFCICLLVLAD